MNKWLFIIFLFLGVTSNAQTQITEPPYKRFPTLPPIQLLLGDSTTKYTKEALPKKKPVLLMLFSPDCSHCQQTAEELPKFRKELKDVQIVMATMYSLTQMNEFAQKYKLNELSNVIVGKDMYYLLPPFYGVRNLPFLAFYNKKGNLISVFEGSMPLEKVANIFKNNK